MKVKLSDECLEPAQLYQDLGGVVIRKDQPTEVPDNLRQQVLLHPELIIVGAKKKKRGDA